MATITVEVPKSIADKFQGRKRVTYREILDIESSKQYTFTDEKVSLKELHDFLGTTISSKGKTAC